MRSLKHWWRHRSFKARLAIWYAATLCIVLAAFAAIAYETVEHRLAAELDRQLRIDFDIVEAQLAVDDKGAIKWPVRGAHGDDGYARLFAWFEVWSEEGQLRMRHWPIPEDAIHSPLRRPTAHALKFYDQEIESNLPARIMERPARIQGQGVIVRVIRDASDMRQTLAQILEVFAIALPLAAAIAAFGGYWLARRALVPVARMSAEARKITSESLGARLPVANRHDEIGQLATVFNETLARLNASFTELKRFSADASHELRTPLTALRAVGESALQEDGDARQLKEAISSMLEEANRLTELTDALLMLARLEAGASVQFEAVDLSTLITSVRDTLAVVADSKRQQLTVHALPERISTTGNAALLRHAFLNIMHNAIRHSPAESRIDVRTEIQSARAFIDISDEGPGIARELRGRVFDRFFRVDAARSRETGGHGLGLAIARSIVERHQGTIRILEKSAHGATFRIELPLAPAP
ncbi:MAG TPA: ATP-binding protein [Steroidobacteraceae bacterium]|nr:ATP-binding protein [Steroidobacteraceae bacterium]